ncbi:GNAT family N-acetyltransferase [Solimonas sp. SE-A11]|uniref:GNAT family N-acetyltransferase n=1 Tax=Solimonas sp. SE-A11 TaxID=3054954 RepID=UPI00259CA67E|nr:GNAT family N-acetyltransferase [Solimonas sp. SE-A11]MDM4772152.1 GNAT family N-acetyltransferase [Solimonas sp. SE-A11]
MTDALQFRLASPQDAEAITACVRAVRGDHYPNRLLYAPEELAQVIAGNRLVFALALLPSTGEVAGLAALEPSPYGRTGELGVMMVRPSQRRQHVADDLRLLLVAWARENGRRGLWGEVLAPLRQSPDTACASQQLTERAQLVPCGIALGLWPGPAGERDSFVRYARPLPPDAMPTACRLAARHRALASEILERLCCPVSFEDESSASGTGILDMKHEAGLCSWSLAVPRIGRDSAAELLVAIWRIQADPGVACAQLELPLAQPGASTLCELAEARGFFFSTITAEPFSDGPGLRLQWLAQAIDPGELVLINPLARRIAEHQSREQARVRSTSILVAA